MDNLILIISSTIFCFFITLKLTPIALFIGEKKGLVDWPNTRKQHEKPKVKHEKPASEQVPRGLPGAHTDGVGAVKHESRAK